MEPQELVGTWRRFGLAGPVYEVIGTGRKLLGGKPSVKIRVLESGEETDYPLDAVLDDPKEK